MFKNEDEEDSFENNNKYIMSNDEEKDIKIETTTNENENENEIKKELNNEIILNNNEINTDEPNIIPVIKYQSNIENKNNINNDIALSNDYDEVKMSIKNYLKDKISKNNNTDNNEIDNVNNRTQV